MKICMICLCLGNVDEEPLIGGHENAAIRLSKALYERGHEITIITTPSRYSNFQSRIVDLEWGKIFSLSISGSYPSLSYVLEFMLKAFYKMKKLHNKEKFDIIHGHAGYTTLGLITGIGGKILGVSSVHTLYYPVQTSGYKISLNRFYLSLIDVIISLSKNTEHSLKRMGVPAPKNMIISPAIDLSSFNPSISGESAKKSLNLKSYHPLLLYAGDLRKTKGLNVLIEALSMVTEHVPDAKLLMAVKMPLEKYKMEKLEIKEKISSLGLDDNVIPLGIVNNMPQIMAASDVFIAPYLSIEGIADYPISILEAMACGKPVIATKVGGIPEIVKHKINGLLVEPDNVHELKNALLYMLENKDEAKKMADNAAKYVAENYSMDAVVQKYEKLYADLINT